MRSRILLLFLLLVAVVFVAFPPRRAKAQSVAPPECVANVYGSWSGPYSLCISCYDDPLPGSCSSLCIHCGAGDEIAHFALIPVGPYAGQLLLWTKCDIPQFNPEYKSHIWDPLTNTLTSIPFPLTGELGPFCSGHAWFLVDVGEPPTVQREPRLLVVGGREAPSCTDCSGTTVYCGARYAIWFDPIAGAWSEAPADLQEEDRNYYPSVLTYEDSANQRFLPLVVGGGKFAGIGGCGEFDRWWRLEPPYDTSSWIVETDDDEQYTWNQYPRTLLLSTGEVLIVGHAISDEPPAGTPGYGDEPVRAINTVLGPQGQDHFLGASPNAQGFPVGGWNYANAVILHTLKPSWSWNPTDPVSQYDLDRVIVTGGSRDIHDDAGVEDWTPALDITLELVGGAQGTWVQKAFPATKRIFSNWVILPDGRILLVGGRDKGFAPVDVEVGFYHQSEIFDPGGPLDSGSWSITCLRPPVDSGSPNYPSIIRGYHHVASLLPDGSVAIAGGAMGAPEFVPDAANNANDTAEIYKPSYFFRAPRPRFTLGENTIHYGSIFCMSVNSPAPEDIDRAVLIGISSVTHHFDYGQRYVELMIDPASCTDGNLRVMAPPIPAMAPDGYYMLFLVDRDGIPSVGQLVLVSY